MAERIDQATFERVISAMRTGNSARASALLTGRFPWSEWIVVLDPDCGQPLSVAQWQATRTSAKIVMTPQTAAISGHRFAAVTPLITECLKVGISGTVGINFNDCGIIAGALTFCDHRPDFPLIPDPEFIATHGYQGSRDTYASKAVPWDRRQHVVFWRGSTTGRPTDGWRSLPRLRLCLIARERPDLFDVGVTRVHQLSEEAEAEIRAAGLFAEYVPESRLDEYRFHIDIDGNTNAWSGLFRKLLSGSPVLKVDSEPGFRQWYYDRLVPWQNFVPVSADLSDLVEKADWLSANCESARQIGTAGRSLALSLGYDIELERATAVVMQAMSTDGHSNR
jgi:hypothetical protein